MMILKFVRARRPPFFIMAVSSSQLLLVAWLSEAGFNHFVLLLPALMGNAILMIKKLYMYK